MKIRRHTTNHAARLSDPNICNIRGSTTAGVCVSGTTRSVPKSGISPTALVFAELESSIDIQLSLADVA